jgi:hypothetical protein
MDTIWQRSFRRRSSRNRSSSRGDVLVKNVDAGNGNRFDDERLVVIFLVHFFSPPFRMRVLAYEEGSFVFSKPCAD